MHNGHTPPGHSPVGRPRDERFEQQPRLVFWEMTKACPLACVHCRATAQREPAAGELSTEEGRRMIDELAGGPRPHPVLILSGGDCLARRDLVDLVSHAQAGGVPVAVAPSVSPRLSSTALAQLKDRGVSHASLSLDGASAATHDAIRQVPGHFHDTLGAIDLMAKSGWKVQVNTAVMARNVGELADIAVLLHALGVRIWEVFFLVNVGRGGALDDISAGEAEDVCNFLVDAARYGIVVRTVEAPFFRRVQRQRAAAESADGPPAGAAGGAAGEAPGGLPWAGGRLYRRLSASLEHRLGGPTTPVLAPTMATRDGKGIIFVAHNGDVYPSGFLPLAVGNVRETPLLQIYRDSPLLHDIRWARFPGRCGSCEYADLCGGSRSRAFAASGDPLGDDPACVLAGATGLPAGVLAGAR